MCPPAVALLPSPLSPPLPCFMRLVRHTLVCWLSRTLGVTPTQARTLPALSLLHPRVGHPCMTGGSEHTCQQSRGETLAPGHPRSWRSMSLNLSRLAPLPETCPRSHSRDGTAGTQAQVLLTTEAPLFSLRVLGAAVPTWPRVCPKAGMGVYPGPHCDLPVPTHAPPAPSIQHLAPKTAI